MDLQLRGSDLRHARDHTADRREGDRRARVGPRAGGEDGPDPARAGAGVPGLSLVRVPRVRPVLAGRGGCGHPRVDALLRQWLHPVHERLDRPERDAALQARLVPLHDRRSPADPGRHGRLRLPRRVRTFSRAPGGLHRGRRGMDSRVRPAPRRHLQEDAARLRRGPGRAVQAERLRQSVPRGRSRRHHRRDRRRPRALRLGLPPPRGSWPSRAATSTTCPRALPTRT